MIPQATNDNISNKTVCTITIGKHACKYIYCVNHGAIFANKYCVKHTIIENMGKAFSPLLGR